ncbi:MAG: hypothetical protein OXC56_01705 [Chloroflexi bacterium]|nr:hypothetical protein [Chloroflexota bacterium]
MEWLVLVLFAALAAAVIALPLLRGRDVALESVDGAELVEERRTLLAELRELDDDAASGRISADERRDGRRALAPRLRAVTEALRDVGLDTRGGA